MAALSLRDLAARLDRSEAETAALRRQLAELRERLEVQAASLAAAWRTLERGTVRAHAPVPPAAAAVERVSAGEAARRLGCDTSTVRRLIRTGRLAGAPVRFPGSARARWTVDAASLASLLPATARSRTDFPGAPRAGEGG